MSSKSGTDTIRPRLAQAARDAERMSEIGRAFRANNPNNPDCDLFDRAAAAFVGIQTRLLALAAGGGSPELDAEPSSDEGDEPTEPTRKGPPVVPPGSRINLPDSHRRAAGESRSSVRGGKAGGHGQLPV